MNWYFITLLALYCMSMGAELAKHGQPRESKHNFWTTAISVAISLWLVIGAIKRGF